MKNKTIEIGISSSFTDAPIGVYIKNWLSVFQMEASIQFASYNQVFQELYDKNGVLASIHNGFQILLIRLEDIIKDNNQAEEWKQQFLKEQYEQLKSAITNNIGMSKRFVGILPVSEELLNSKLGKYIEKLNDEWLEFLDGNEQLIAIDMRKIAKTQDTYNSYTDEIAHMPYQEKFYEMVSCILARKIHSFYQPPFKVIVVDCDNTLWNGICGEVGAKGVVIDEGRIAFQNFLLECYNKGMLLAISSKNNEADVLEVFEQREDMRVKSEHFVCKKINWDNKSKNIKEIAQELNLGLSSFVFIDDSKAECNEMMMNCTEVLTLKIPEESNCVMDFISNIWAFDISEVLEDDRLRTKYYLEEQSRLASKTEDMSIEEYMESLHVNVYVYDADEEVKRVSQLTQRTNQFNLTTKRMDEDEVAECLNNKEMQCKVIAVEDKFGCYGVTGAFFVSEQEDALFLNLLLLSCRVLGRGVEKKLLAYMKKLCIQKNKKVMRADFYPTPRNEQVRTFLINSGWEIESNTELYERYSIAIETVKEESKVIEEPLKINSVVQENYTKEMSIAQDIHHIGVAVRDMEKAIDKYRNLGYQVGTYVKDNLQDAFLVMCDKENHISVELIAPANVGSSIQHYIKEEDYIAYHICVEVKNHECLYDTLRNRGILFDIVSEPKEAILFDYRKVGFIYVKAFGLIEYIETNPFQEYKNCEADVLQVFTSNKSIANEIASLFGYQASNEWLKNNNNTGTIQLLERDNLNNKAIEYQIVEYKQRWESDLIIQENSNEIDYEIFIANDDKLLHRGYYEPAKYWLALKGGITNMENEDKVDKEKVITDMAKSILGVEHINSNDNFYKIGGNSFKIIKLLSQIYDVYHKEIPLIYAFQNPTIKSLYEFIQS